MSGFLTEGIISVSPKHAIKLQYELGNKEETVLWESIKETHALQTSFNAEGGIIDQKLLKLEQYTIRHLADDFIGREGIDVREGVFEEVKLDKQCPHCGKHAIKRFSQGISEPSAVPVMPMYICMECKGQSYFLTDEYLDVLIKKHKDMFESAELEELSKNEQTFIKEVKEYIIRVFAAKKVLNIK